MNKVKSAEEWTEATSNILHSCSLQDQYARHNEESFMHTVWDTRSALRAQEDPLCQGQCTDNCFHVCGEAVRSRTVRLKLT